jgi:hypothetical protein
MNRQLALVATATALLTFTTACGSDEPSTADEVSSLCEDLSAVQSSVDEISSASFDPATTTKNSIQETLTNLQSEVDSAISEAEDVSDSVKSTLSDAFETYKSAPRQSRVMATRRSQRPLTRSSAPVASSAPRGTAPSPN